MKNKSRKQENQERKKNRAEIQKERKIIYLIEGKNADLVCQSSEQRLFKSPSPLWAGALYSVRLPPPPPIENLSVKSPIEKRVKTHD